MRVDPGNDVPRLSAAIIIPSLNLIARTDVPVTMGCLNGGLDKLKRHERYKNNGLCVLYCARRSHRLILAAVMERIGCTCIESVIFLRKTFNYGENRCL